ncbi:survival motor neuron protein, putative [Pediculus humanus corporis]|uniref:Survival motor neuron protein, putative n=1 Tax=Pediculus humanus subsp. corporis TaxID=121224 RepID=E0VIW4_PEDHC|nr:survival motor neuron protein, putative [Pediculus humanus corporis]EEB13320.1 survival motor neuron protein, putative [Pediculus humanus corporis]
MLFCITNAKDIWDDAMLVEAYDRAVKFAREGCVEENTKKVYKKGKEHYKWKVGDKCRCQYSEDKRYYEAEIMAIIDSTGMCKIKYYGYENEENVQLRNLKPSNGEEAILQQIREATNDNNVTVADETMRNSNIKCEPIEPTPSNKKNNYKKTESSTSLKFSPSNKYNCVMPPPPPPPHMFKNMCGDEDETEAMNAMLISWYMNGYHTGYYHGLKMAKNQ